MKAPSRSVSPGGRVGCILSANEGAVLLLGYGVYEGDDIPYGAVGPLAEQIISVERRNPKIVLDGGKVVWGCECWWGPEEQVKQAVSTAEKTGKTVVLTDIDDVRSAYVPPRRWFEPED